LQSTLIQANYDHSTLKINDDNELRWCKV